MSERSFKLSLNNHELAEDFFEDTRLLGIMVHGKRLPVLLASQQSAGNGFPDQS